MSLVLIAVAEAANRWYDFQNPRTVMGLLFKYFSAESDGQAAGGVERGPDRSVFDVVDLPDLDSHTMLAAVEHFLTGRDEDEIADGPRFYQVLADHGGAAITTVTDELQRALVDSSDERLAEVAAAMEDYAGFKTELLAGLLVDLAALARRATAGGRRVYCWTSL